MFFEIFIYFISLFHLFICFHLFVFISFMFSFLFVFLFIILFVIFLVFFSFFFWVLLGFIGIFIWVYSLLFCFIHFYSSLRILVALMALEEKLGLGFIILRDCGFFVILWNLYAKWNFYFFVNMPILGFCWIFWGNRRAWSFEELYEFCFGVFWGKSIKKFSFATNLENFLNPLL